MYSRIAKNARLGDGCVNMQTSCINANLSFISTDLEVLKIKRKMCEDEGFVCRDFGTQSSGYGGTKTIYNFYTRVNEKITEVYNANLEDLIASIDKEDLFMWLIDDGSWHKNQHLFHLYCNMLDDYQANLLIDKIFELYGIKPRLRKDRKRDGREFNYLYFTRQLTLLMRLEFKDYLKRLELASMMYKVGGEGYSDPLEKLSSETIISSIYQTISKKYASGRIYDKQTKVDEFNDFVRVSWVFNNQPRERIISKEAI